MKSKVYFIVFLIFSPGRAFGALTCEAVLRTASRELVVHMETTAEGAIKINGAPARVYPLPMVLKNFRMTKADLEKFKGKKVLLLGEGFGQLLPALVEVGADVKAVDLMYSLDRTLIPDTWMGRLIRRFLDRYQDRLIPATAQNLPIADAEYDFVMSHMLINNFVSIEPVKLIIDETFVF